MTPQWTNRITRYSEEAPDQLLANPRNFRTHPASQAEALTGVLREVGIVQNVIANERTGHLIDGHLRVMEALKAGQASIPVTWVDLSVEEESLILATLDPLSAMAGTDAAQLEALLHEVQTGEAAVQAMIDALATEAGIVPPVEMGAGGDEFDATPDDGPTRAQLGDLWIIGGVHRLLVGDCTDPANVARLMQGERADIYWSDPPYNVDVAGGAKDPRSEKHRNGNTIQNDDMSPEDFRIFLASAFVAADAVMREGAVYYIAHPDIFAYEFIGATRDVGWVAARPPVVQWVKDSMVFGRGDYHSQSEPMLYGWKPGAAHHAVTDRTQTNVWNIPRPKASEDHPTMKPVELVERAVRNSSALGAIVLDSFLGSGTSLIAAHRAGRRCYGMEIAPRYADVILRRAEAEGLTVERDTTTT